MSKTNIPEKVKIKLWVAAGGRCQFPGCNKILIDDSITGKVKNSAYIAHIIADSPDGPRGDIVKSPKLAKEFSNLMLLCDEHHREVDGDPEMFSADKLQAWKNEHEKRIQTVTNVITQEGTIIVTFLTNIMYRKGMCSFNEAVRTIFPDYFPIMDRLFEIDLTTLSKKENQQGFYELMLEEINDCLIQLHKLCLRGEIKHISLFALAPIPALILFGSSLGDTLSLSTFQKTRTPDTWDWQNEKRNEFIFSDVSNPNIKNKVALKISISMKVHNEDIYTAIGNNSEIFEISINDPMPDVIKNKNDLDEFGKVYLNVLSRINNIYGTNTEVHLFAAIPNSIAIECGRRILPKVHNLTIYDYIEGSYRKIFNTQKLNNGNITGNILIKL